MESLIILIAVALMGFIALGVFITKSRFFRAIRTLYQRRLGWEKRKMRRKNSKKKQTKLAPKKTDAKSKSKRVVLVIILIVGALWLAIRIYAIGPVSSLFGEVWKYVAYTVAALAVIGLAFFLIKKIPKKSGENKIIPDWLAHEAVLAAIVVIILMGIIAVVSPDFFEKWLGGPNGFWFGVVAVVGIALAVFLQSKKVPWIVWGGIAVLALSPAIFATRPGKIVGKVYEKTVQSIAEDEDRDGESFRQRALASGERKSIDLDARRWEVGLLGDRACFGARYTRGILDGAPNLVVRCLGGEIPDLAKWPKHWGGIPSVGAPIQDAIAFRDSTSVEFVNMSPYSIRVYAKVP